jgi:hypothetical protein
MVSWIGPYEAFDRVHTIARGSASVLVLPDVETQYAGGFVKIIALFGSLAPPVFRPTATNASVPTLDHARRTRSLIRQLFG